MFLIKIRAKRRTRTLTLPEKVYKYSVERVLRKVGGKKYCWRKNIKHNDHWRDHEHKRFYFF